MPPPSSKPRSQTASPTSFADILGSFAEPCLIVNTELHCLAVSPAMIAAARIEGNPVDRPIWEIFPQTRDANILRHLRQSIVDKQPVSFHINHDEAGISSRCECHPAIGGALVIVNQMRQSDDPSQCHDSVRLPPPPQYMAGFWDMKLDPESPHQLPDNVYFSPSQKRILGYGDAEFPNSLQAWRERIVPQDAEALDGRMKLHLDGLLDTFECEYRAYHRDGSIRCLLTRGNATRDAQGRPIRWSGITFDNTDYKSQEQTRAELAAIVATTDAAIICCTPDGIISTWNVGAERIYGYRSQEAIGNDYAMLLPISTSVSPRFLRHLREGGRYRQLEALRRRKDGALIDMSISLSPLFDSVGRHVASSLIEHDITQRKNIQEALRRSEARFRSIFDQAAVGIAQLGHEGQIEIVNPRLCEILGMRREHLLNKPLHELIYPDDPFDPERHMEHLRQGEADSFSREMRCLSENGRELWVNMTVTVIESPNRHRVSFIAIVEDITLRKETENDLKSVLLQLRELNQTLERRIAERTETLVRKQELLQELLTQLNNAEQEERRRLATQLHDYLPQILVAAKMKLARVRRLEIPKRGTELLEDINRNLDDALKFSRTLVAEISPTILYEFGLDAAMPSLARRMEELGLNVKIDSQGEPRPLTEALAGFLYQSIRELLYNSAKHAHADSATVAIDWRNDPLQVRVSDSGRGFDVPSVRFRQIERGSFGLLNIEQRLETLGGELRIDSQPGHGATVILRVPLAPPHATSGDSTHPKSLSTEKQTRVLIAADDPIMRENLRLTVERWPETEVVGEAADGAETMAMSLSRKPDIVLMHSEMPVMDSAETTRHILRQAPDTLVFGIADNLKAPLVESMRNAGASGFLSEKFDPAELWRLLCQRSKLVSVAPSGPSFGHRDILKGHTP